MRSELRFGLSRLRGRAFVGFVAWSVPEALPSALLGYAVARSVDDGFLAGQPVRGLLWLALVIPASVLSAVGARQVLRCLGGIVEPLRDDLVERVVTTSLRRTVAGLPDDGAVARLTRQVEVVRDSYAGLLLVAKGFVVSVTGAVIGLLSLSPVIVALIMPPFLLGLLGFVASLGLAARRHRAAAVAEEDVAASATAVLAGTRDVIACGATDYASASVGWAVDAQAAAERALAGVAALRTLCFAVGGWLPVLVLLGAAPRLETSAGIVLGGLTYVLSGLQAALLKLMGGVGGSGMRYVITLRRLLCPPPASPRRVTGSGARLVARDVSFAYGPHSEPIVHGLDLSVSEGDHLAIIGPSGIGKSTLARILCGLLPPTGGRVEVGETVLIPQEAYVFTGTLRENLTYLRPDADPTEALVALGAEHLIAGLDAQVSPGRLPAGQRQLIALARSYLSPAPIAVLDEATCHLDPAAEAVVERAFAARPGALVVIAHRLGSALRARHILVLDGQTATLGDHESLMSASPLYRELMRPPGGRWRPPSTLEEAGLPPRSLTGNPPLVRSRDDTPS